jgi:hypothetical protein
LLDEEPVAPPTTAITIPTTAGASVDVVPNPGYEQGGCANTPIICGWNSNNQMDETGSPVSLQHALDCA